MSVISAMMGVAAIFLIIGVGVAAAKRGHLSQEAEVQLTRLTIAYAVPALVFSNTVEQLPLEMLRDELGWYILLPFVIILAGYALAQGLGAALGLNAAERGTSSALFAMANVIFIGLPVCLAIFGEWSAPYVVAYLPANTILFWTIGNIGMMRSKGVKIRELIKHMVSPPLAAFVAALAIILLRVDMPDFVLLGARMLGGMATPAALLIVGATFSRMELRKIFAVPKMVALTLAGRCVIMPAMAFVICRIAGAPWEMTVIFTVISGMPAMAQAVLVARRHNACVNEVAHAFALTTLVSMLLAPLVVLVLGLM